MYEKRGTYKSTYRGRQLLRFDGLELDSHITPMDVDAMIEYHDQKRVLIEVKLQNTPVPQGERLALERFVNDFGNLGKTSIAIIADHKVFDTKEDVLVRDCIVREIYHSDERYWREPNRMLRVSDLLNLFLYD